MTVGRPCSPGAVQMTFHFLKVLMMRVNRPNIIRNTTVYRQTHFVLSCILKNQYQVIGVRAIRVRRNERKK